MVVERSGNSQSRGRSRGRLWLAQLAIGGVLLSVCYHEVRPCETPAPFYLTLEGGTNLNPDEHRHPLPTQVLVFQLKGLTRFNAAGFDDLWQRSKETLGDELLQVNEVSVAPGVTSTVGFPRNAQTTFVAVVGVFRKHAGDNWRAVTPLAIATGDQCTPQPPAIKPKPGRDDVVLKFRLAETLVENLTPPPPPHGGCS
jgi:type VI secretion system protein VasD